MALTLKPGAAGSSLTKFNALPAYVQYQFPAMGHPATVTMRYTLDNRYNSNLYGGNPCATAMANVSHECDMCIDKGYGTWDYAAKPGFYVLWSARKS